MAAVQIVEYDVECKQFTAFSRKLSSKLPSQWINRSSTVRHITFDPRHPDVVILHDDSVICTINKNRVMNSLPVSTLVLPNCFFVFCFFFVFF